MRISGTDHSSMIFQLINYKADTSDYDERTDE